MKPVIIIAIVIGISVSVMGIVLFQSNNQPQSELDIQYQKELDYCTSMIHDLNRPTIDGINCTESVLEKYNIPAEIREEWRKSIREILLNETFGTSLSDCDLSSKQQMMIETLKNNDSLDENSKMEQAIQIIKEACN